MTEDWNRRIAEAVHVRDLAREASSRDLEAKRVAEAQVERYRQRIAELKQCVGRLRSHANLEGNRASAAVDKAKALEAQNRQLREALEPFAKAEFWGDTVKNAPSRNAYGRARLVLEDARKGAGGGQVSEPLFVGPDEVRVISADQEIAEAVAAEREACAKLAEDYSDRKQGEYRDGHKVDQHLAGMSDGADEVANLIRSRGMA